MFSKDTIRFAPGLKAALLSGAMGLALVGCDAVRDDPAPAPTAAGSPAGAPATVGAGTGTGAPQTDEQTRATGDVGSMPGVEAEGAPTVGADGQVTTPGGVGTDDDTTVEAGGAPTVGADGQVTTPGGVGDSVGAEGAQVGGGGVGGGS
jgi:hypothetical protein